MCVCVAYVYVPCMYDWKKVIVSDFVTFVFYLILV